VMGERPTHASVAGSDGGTSRTSISCCIGIVSTVATCDAPSWRYLVWVRIFFDNDLDGTHKG